MSIEVTLAVLCAALLHAAWNAMLKGGRDVLMDTAAIVIGAGLLALPLLFFVPIPAAASWPFLLGSIATHIAYYYLMINAYRTGDLSLVYPLMRGVAPLITAVLGMIWLRELPVAVSWLGMLLISVGVMALALNPRQATRPGAGKSVRFALANAAVIAVYTLIDGAGARLAGDPWAYIVWLFALDAAPFALYMLVRHRREFVHGFAERRLHGLVGGGFSGAAYGISVWAMTKAPVALVASLRETSVLFAALIGARMLKERLTARRWAGIAAVVAGVLALKAS